MTSAPRAASRLTPLHKKKIMQDNNKNAHPEELEQAFSREREKIHQEMLSSVSHDLKTPLAAVIGSLEIYERMGKALGPEKSAQLIATALQEAYRLDNFVTNILDMAKLDNGLVKMRKEPCDLETLLRDSIEKALHRHKGLKITLVPVSGLNPVHTDPALFIRLVSLLLDNAAKHAQGAGVEIRLKQVGNGAEVLVSDSGPGIPDGREEEIFSKYTRIKYQDRQHAGTGLGLSIARGLAHLLGGQLKAGNGASGGAVFTFTLKN